MFHQSVDFIAEWMEETCAAEFGVSTVRGCEKSGTSIPRLRESRVAQKIRVVSFFICVLSEIVLNILDGKDK
jgi:hypothetical protein